MAELILMELLRATKLHFTKSILSNRVRECFQQLFRRLRNHFIFINYVLPFCGGMGSIYYRKLPCRNDACVWFPAHSSFVIHFAYHWYARLKKKLLLVIGPQFSSSAFETKTPPKHTLGGFHFSAFHTHTHTYSTPLFWGARL